MKHVFIFLATIATTYAALLSNEYLPPLDDVSPTSYSDLQSLSDSGSLADDGYRYKTVKRFRLRHRRDVSELPRSEYLPPTQTEAVVADVPVLVDVPVQAVQESAVLADDGYRYRTVTRIRYRHRRNVNELPFNEYLPPTAVNEIVEEVSPVIVVQQDSSVLADDGYRYKTSRRLRYRHRRDVSELPLNEYLPPAQEIQFLNEGSPVLESAPLTEDGYQYKTVKRVVFKRIK